MTFIMIPIIMMKALLAKMEDTLAVDTAEQDYGFGSACSALH